MVNLFAIKVNFVLRLAAREIKRNVKIYVRWACKYIRSRPYYFT